MRAKLAAAVDWFSQPLHFFLSAVALIPILLVVIFAYIHRQDFPRNEEFLYTMPIVAEFQDYGRINLALFFVRIGGLHITFFPLLVTFLSFLVADWNIDFELTIIFIAVLLNYLMLVGLFYRSQPDALPLILLPFSMLLFSVHQDVNWYMGYYGGTWHLPGFFFVLGLSLIEWFPDRWWSLVAAAIASLCAMLSFTPGILAWVLIGAYLPFSGHRKRVYYLFWGLSATLAIALYSIPVILPSTGPIAPAAAVVLSNPSYQLYALFVRLGASFVSRWWVGDYFNTFTLAFAVGLFGCAWLVTNTILIWRQRGDFQIPARWLAVAGYGFGSAVLMSLSPTRATPISRVFISWYDTAVGIFWIALAASVVLVLWPMVKSGQPETHRQRIWVSANLAACALLFAFYIIQNQRIEITSATSSHPDNQAAGPPVSDECAEQYVFTLEEACLPYHLDIANQLAARRLAVYARLEPTNIMPADYEPGEWIVVVTDTAWGSVHARDWVLAGVEPDNLFFVFPADEQAFEEMPRPPEKWLDSRSEQVGEQLLQETDAASRIWIVRPDQTPALNALEAALLDNGYTQVEQLSGEWIITRYERLR